MSTTLVQILNITQHHIKKLSTLGCSISLVLCTLWLCSSSAGAYPRLIRPGTKANVFYGGIGPSVGLGRGYSASLGSSFTIHNTLGHHFSGDSSGPALGGDIDLRFDGGFGITLGPRFWWDIPIGNMGIYVSPYFRMGFSLLFEQGNTTPALNFKGGVRGKVVLNDSFICFLDLSGINGYVLFTSVGTFTFFEYQFLLGGGFIF